MITFIIVTYLVMTMAGSGILIHGVAVGPVGFEDEQGYHSLGEADLMQAYSATESRIDAGRR
jgi:hypothetical protein